MRDPYRVGGPVRDGEFYGRGKLLETLLAQRQQCIYLVGNRMVGKTSLLLQLKAKARHPAIFLDLQATGGEWSLIGTKLEEAAARDLRVALRLAPGQDFVDGLKQLQSASHETLLLIDEGDLLLIQSQDDLARLRATLFEAERLRTIIAATKKLARLSDPSFGWIGSPFLFGFRAHYVSPLDPADARELMRQSHSDGDKVRVSARLADEISELTGNHPYLLQRVCSRLFSESGSLRRLNEADTALDEDVVVVFETDYLRLSGDERAVLDVVRDAGCADAEAVSRTLGIDVARLRGYLLNLEGLGYLRVPPRRGSKHHPGYRIAGSLTERWLRSRKREDAAPVVSDRASLEVAADASRYEYTVFLCHAHADRPRVLELAERLKTAGISYWLDKERIEPPDSITMRINDGLSRSRFVLACLSPKFLGSNWTSAEAGAALNAQLSGPSTRRVIPLLLEPIPREQIPPLLLDRRFTRLDDDSDINELIRFLLRSSGLPPG